ncbi:MAG: ABC transporter substrate-binding protein [Anaerolineaceae bacterium]|nr:ABC transporter substrate-binding protein [Anaerolineaceae bacterium]
MNRIAACLAMLLSLSFGAVLHAQTETECADDAQLIVHAMGETCVPKDVERVVALEWSYTEDLLALGIQPIAIADIAGYNNWLKIPITLDENVQDIGTRNEPNLEVITQLNPDLIIGVFFRVTENYDDLSAIAPTIVFNPYPADGASHFDEMITTFETIAKAVNREAEAAVVLEQMQDYFAQASTLIEEAGHSGEGFILSQSFLSSEVPTFRLFTSNAMAVEVLEQMGLQNDWTAEPELYGFTTVDMEAFVDIEDTNFFYVAQDDYNATLTETPLWNSLPFVTSGRTYWMGGDVWLFGGPLSAQVLVDTVLQAMGIELPAPEATPEATVEASS